ncbi:uncharacterized protein N7487_003636 [Penicillium crustosum]|uniref:uncharacterized protein n=1 Tax=Penicillium crustosum TaxID=36656 RepID=UPI0023A5793F|nr:uncharacterized protein N7487_003636 [Penicillium crustosum]KAJ5409277.1 hypothetical protein N7487_003636 [Penicillium crustosum]
MDSPPTSEGGPENLDNAFARTGRWELVNIRAWAPIIVHGLQKGKKIDRRRDRTCNLLIRSQAPCHWASRPRCCEIFGLNVHHKRRQIFLGQGPT